MNLSRRHLVILLAAFVLSRVVLVGVGVAASRFLSSVEGEEYTHLLDGGSALDMWYRWDAGFYATIATFGYDWINDRQPSADMAFLPVYPALVRLASGINGDRCALSPYLSTCATVGGLIISNVAMLASCFLLYEIARRHVTEAAALRAVLLLLFAPNAIFLAGVYTESVFLLLVLLTFALLDRRRFGLAVATACLACLTRSVGVALVPVLLYWSWRQFDGRARLFALAASLLPAAVFGTYVLGAGLSVGDPLAFFSAYEGIWGRSSSPLDAILIYTREPVAVLGWNPSWLDLAATAFVLSLALWILFRWKQRTWGLYALFATLIPIASGSLIGMPRFGAVIFPIYIVLGRWTDTLWKQVAVFAPSVLLMLLFAARFVTWRWIA